MNLAHFLKWVVQPNQTLKITTMKKSLNPRQLCILSCVLVTYFLVILAGIFHACKLSVSL